MKLRISPIGWLLLTIIFITAMLLGIIFGRTNYIPDRCEQLKDTYQQITRDNPEYREYLDSNHNGIACE